ncbi:MAG: hypothetical protein KBT46_01915 [Ruminococcus sp.]|nr:hypothetical protein [Candidatus Copronaster equi]
MADKKKEKELDEELELNAEENADENKANLGDDWVWDASTPETSVDNLTFEALAKDEKKKTAEKADTTENNEEKAEEADSEEIAEDSDDDGLCIVCGNHRGKSPSDLYCEECRSKFLKTNYGVGHIILAFVMALVVVLSYCTSIATGKIAVIINDAQKNLEANKLNSVADNYTELSTAVDDFNTVVNGVIKGVNKNALNKEWFVVGNRANDIELKAMLKTLTIIDYKDFISAVDSILNEKQLNSSKYAEVKSGYDFCKDLDTVASSVAEKWQTYIQGDGTDENYKIPYEETLKYLDSFKAQTDAQKSYINFYKALTAYNAKKDNKITLQFFEDAYKLAGKYSFTYLSTYMALTYEVKDYDKLLEVCNAAIKNDPSSTTAYNFASKVYVMRSDFINANQMCEKLKEVDTENIDYYCMKAEILRRESKFDESVKICEKAIKDGNEFSEIYRQEAISYYLAGNKNKALEAVKKAYDISLQNAYSGNQDTLIADMNTAAVITSLCGDKDKHKEAVDILSQVGTKLLDNAEKCIKGEMKFEDIFMKGVGDIQ